MRVKWKHTHPRLTDLTLERSIPSHTATHKIEGKMLQISQIAGETTEDRARHLREASTTRCPGSTRVSCLSQRPGEKNTFLA